MLNFGPEKMLVIMFIAMLVLGPEKLPEVARKMGRVMAELRRMSGGFQDEVRRAMDDTTGMSGLREIKQELSDTARGAVSLPTAADGDAPAASSTEGAGAEGVAAPTTPAPGDPAAR